MKKYFLQVLCLIMFTTSLSARTVISNYENPEITTEDILDCFVEELNKPRYAYALYDYEVYKTKSNQENCWTVEVSDCSYEEGKHSVAGEQVTLFISNGYFTLKTFGGETQESTIANGVTKATDLNDEEKCDDFYSDLIDNLKEFALKSAKWQKKYDAKTIQTKETAELFFINYDWLWGFSYGNYAKDYDNYYGKFPSDAELPDFTKLESHEITDYFAEEIMEMTNYAYPLTTYKLSLDYYGSTPEGYKKVLEDVNYTVLFNTDKKQYYYIELVIYENTEDSYNKEIIYIDMDERLYYGDKIEKENIDYIASYLDDDVYYQGIFDDYNKKLEEDDE